MRPRAETNGPWLCLFPAGYAVYISRERVLSLDAAGERAPVDRASILASLHFRPALQSYSDEELAQLFDAFDLEARYNHYKKTLKLSVTVFPELAEILNANDRPMRPVAANRS